MSASPATCFTCGAATSAAKCEACGAQVDLAVLEVIRGAQKGAIFPLGPRAYVVGRSREADIVLHDTSVSRRHGRVSWEPDGYRIEDLDSAHGIYVDQLPASRAPLRPGCLIQMAGVTLRFEFLDADAITSEVPLTWLGSDAEGGVASQAATAALDRLHLGVVLIDGEGRVVARNKSAEEMLAERDGIELRGATLHVADIAASRRLRGLLSSSDAGSLRGGALSIPRTPPRPPLTLLVAPLGGHEGRGPVVKAVFMSARDRGQETGEEHLRRLYDLTPSEAAMASLLVQGRSLKEAALELGVTESTARTHLKRIFDKTDTHRQGELVGLLLSGPGQIRED